MDASISPVGVRTMVTTRWYPSPSKSSRRAPVIWQVGRLENLDIDRRTAGLKDQCWVARAAAPSGVDEHPVDVSFEPTAVEPVQLMVVGLTRSEGPVRH